MQLPWNSLPRMFRVEFSERDELLASKDVDVTGAAAGPSICVDCWQLVAGEMVPVGETTPDATTANKAQR